jgi:hypothetical protein
METLTTTTNTLNPILVAEKQKISIFSRFLNWSESQEKYRFGWLAIALVGHGCVITPITMFSIVLSGNFLAFWILAIVAMMLALVTNLAAMPTKVTIPAFFLSIIIDLYIIISCLIAGFDITRTYI